MSVADVKYKELIRLIHKEGDWDRDEPCDVRAKYADGSPAYSKGVFGVQIKFNEGELPLLTCKKVFTKTAINEMICIWVKQTNVIQDFRDMGVNAWNEWELPDGTMGLSYGAQLQKGNKNQVDELLKNIMENWTSRRLMTSFWDFENVDKKSLQECAWATNWRVRQGKLDLVLISRSSDVGLGLVWNWFQYSVLQHVIAHVSGLDVGTFTHQIGDAHYYDRHEDILLKQLDLPEYDEPHLYIRENLRDFYDLKAEDVEVVNYKHGDYLKMEVAI